MVIMQLHGLRLLGINVATHKAIARPFFSYFRIAFNSVDADRLKVVGPDRLCAEWMLKNGGGIRYVGSEDSIITNYNSLPPTSNRNSIIGEIDGTDSSIMDIGFEHLKGCNHIKKVNLTRCKHIENESMQKLAAYLKDTLEDLSVIDCFNLETVGLLYLTELSKLKKLVVSGVPYIKDVQHVKEQLTSALPNCDIEITQ